MTNVPKRASLVPLAAALSAWPAGELAAAAAGLCGLRLLAYAALLAGLGGAFGAACGRGLRPVAAAAAAAGDPPPLSARRVRGLAALTAAGAAALAATAFSDGVRARWNRLVHWQREVNAPAVTAGFPLPPRSGLDLDLQTDPPDAYLCGAAAWAGAPASVWTPRGAHRWAVRAVHHGLPFGAAALAAAVAWPLSRPAAVMGEEE